MLFCLRENAGCKVGITVLKYYKASNQTWGQFHLSIPIRVFSPDSFAKYFLPWVGTPSTYLEYLLWVVYIPSRIVMEEIFLN